MKSPSNRHRLIGLCLVSLVLLGATPARAYPPAPHHVVYGMARDQFGTPIQSDADVILETSAGVQIKTTVIPGLEPGVNYRLTVPMDAGLTSDLYKANALRPTVPFKIKIKIGQTTYLPIEMLADFSRLGEPGEKTLLNLTLGEDSDGDGLPDAWERALIALTGGKRSLADIQPQDDSDGDGMSNLDEYISGNYAFDKRSGLSLKMIEARNGSSVFEFTAIRGRNYSVCGSNNLHDWTPVEFKIPADGPDAPLLSNYQAVDIRLLRVEVGTHPTTEAFRFFKLKVE
jgi:hypothetical protein